MKRLFYFVLTSRYPSNKAYAVTVGRTCSEFKKMGEECSVITGWLPNNVKTVDNYGNSVIKIKGRINASPLNKILNQFPRFSFIVNQFILGYNITKHFQEMSKVNSLNFIYREPYVLILPLLFLRNSNCILEIHHKIRGIRLLVLKRLVKRKNLSVTYISDWLKSVSALETAQNQSVISMGVSDDFFQEHRISFDGVTSICYLGKAKSNGVDNGISEVLRSFVSSCQDREMSITYIGLDDFAKEQEIESIARSSKNISIYIEKNIEHFEVPKKLARYRYGLLPYPDNDYHSDRFPIKALEYAASGLVILATDTFGNRNIIPPNCAIFFNPNDRHSMTETFKKMDDLEMLLKIQKSAYQWALLHKYSDRVSRFLNQFTLLNDRINK